MVLAEDELLRGCDASLRPIQERVERRIDWPAGYPVVVIGGDPALKTRVLQRLPPEADVTWFLCEKGQRPDYAAVDATLRNGRAARVVLLTHHVSHALSHHVRKSASALRPGTLVMPDLPGMSGVIDALERLH